MEGNLIILEETIYDNSAKTKISIRLDPSMSRDKGYYMRPYIKVTNGKYVNSRNSFRISMVDAMIIRSHSDGKNDWDPSMNDLRELNRLMFEKSTLGKYKGLTVYDAIYECIAEKFPGQSIVKFQCPDFTKAYYEK